MTSDRLIEGKFAVEFPTWVLCKYGEMFVILTEGSLQWSLELWGLISAVILIALEDDGMSPSDEEQ